MSLRGEIVIECDIDGCHAEQRYSAEDFFSSHILSDAIFKGWRVYRLAGVYRFVCPQCVDEKKVLP